jgi:plasmid maintenance system killer protein
LSFVAYTTCYANLFAKIAMLEAANTVNIAKAAKANKKEEKKDKKIREA